MTHPITDKTMMLQPLISHTHTLPDITVSSQFDWHSGPYQTVPEVFKPDLKLHPDHDFSSSLHLNIFYFVYFYLIFNLQLTLFGSDIGQDTSLFL